MKIIETQAEGLAFQAKVIIPAHLIQQEVEKELNKLSKTVKLKGFRSGKVPTGFIEKKYGASIRQDVIQTQVNQTVKQIIRENNLNISSETKVEFTEPEDKQAIAFTAKFELLPVISLPDFSKISLEKIRFEIQDADIDNEIEKFRKACKEYAEEKKGEIAEGDQAIINGEGYLDGKAFNGGKLENYKLVIGSKTFIDNFEEQLIGYKAGDHVTVHVTFPADYGVRELANKLAEFRVRIAAVYQPMIPICDDKFAHKYGFADLEELRERLSARLKQTLAESTDSIIKIRLFDALEELLTFEAPESLLNKEYQSLKKSLDEASSYDKENVVEQNEEHYKKLVLRRVRIGLMLSEYAKVKKIQIENSDIKEAIVMMARQFPGREKETIEFYKKNPYAADALKGQILERKTVAHILTHAVHTTEKLYTKQEIEELIEESFNNH